jgi:hypothetical protein
MSAANWQSGEFLICSNEESDAAKFYFWGHPASRVANRQFTPLADLHVQSAYRATWRAASGTPVP